MGQTWPSAASPGHFMGNPHTKPFLAVLLLTLMGLCFPSELFRVAAGTQRCLSVVGALSSQGFLAASMPAPGKQGRLCVSQLPDAAVGKDKSRALPSGFKSCCGGVGKAVQEGSR